MKIKTLLVLGLLALSFQVYADEVPTDSYAAKTVVGRTCQITSATLLEFNNYLPISVNANEAKLGNANLGVRCTIGTNGVAIRINPGVNSPSAACLVSGVNGRRMRYGLTSSYVLYGLYMDPDHQQPWGCEQANQYNVPTFVSSIEAVQIPVYGLIPPGQNGRSGQYTDTLTASIVF